MSFMASSNWASVSSTPTIHPFPQRAAWNRSYFGFGFGPVPWMTRTPF